MIGANDHANGCSLLVKILPSLLAAAAGLACPAEAAKLLVVSENATLADQVKTAVLETAPFAEIPNFMIDIVLRPPISLGCGDYEESENTALTHVWRCDDDKIADLLLERAANRVIVIIHSNDSVANTGVGAVYTTVTEGSILQMGPKVAVHELGHGIGFGDEYVYDSVMAVEYCVENWRALNLTMLKVQESYSSELRARNFVGAYVPWYPRIGRSTPILTGDKLGTPTPGVVGLYKSHVCDNAKNGVTAWLPIEEETLMGGPSDLDLGFPSFYFPYIYEAFGEVYTGQ